MEYTVIRSNLCHKLTKAVQRKLEKGWYPQGSVQVYESEDARGKRGVSFAQAMVQPENDLDRDYLGVQRIEVTP